MKWDRPAIGNESKIKIASKFKYFMSLGGNYNIRIHSSPSKKIFSGEKGLFTRNYLALLGLICPLMKQEARKSAQMRPWRFIAAVMLLTQQYARTLHTYIVEMGQIKNHMILGFFWSLQDKYRIICRTSRTTSQNQTVWFRFLTHPAQKMTKLHLNPNFNIGSSFGIGSEPIYQIFILIASTRSCNTQFYFEVRILNMNI